MSEQMKLEKADELLEIEGRHYGAEQSWLSKTEGISKFFSDRSCGVAAAANVMMYLSGTREEYKSLFDASRKQDDVSKQMKQLYGKLRPTVYGVPTLGSMSRGVRAYAHSKGLDLKVITSAGNMNQNELISFIIQGLENDSPVLLLTWNHLDKDFSYHWVTVTGFYTDENDKKHMVVSNWGRKKVYDIEKYSGIKSLYKGAMYFL